MGREDRRHASRGAAAWGHPEGTATGRTARTGGAVMKRKLLVALSMTLVLMAAKCGEDGPTSGDISVNLATPFSDDGAIQFTASPTTPATITAVGSACSGCKLFAVKLNDNQYKGVITGNITAGTLF